ncbi:hypothetical protein [Halomonas elongata]|uniref:hypothetical protein n=1 Tax=Halomonas elongata TaxID=2746 RepID=UPI004034DDAC
MGDYGERISERIRHVGRKQPFGFCVICGNYGKLVQDHVPPQGAISITSTEQHLVREVSGENLKKKVKGVISPNGSKFKTICQVCNGDCIGSGDDEVKRVHKELTNQIIYYYKGFSLYPFASVRFDSVKYLKAMIGHMLSATSSSECAKEQSASEHFDPMKRLVLYEDLSIFKTHHIYCWFYPYERHLSAKLVGFRNKGVISRFSLLSFHPVALMVSSTEGATFPSQASKIEYGNKFISIDISMGNIKYAQFPFIELERDQLYLVNDYLCTTSRPLIK